jgi:hypothetical protein
MRTPVVFKILRVLAKTRDLGRALTVESIGEASHPGKSHTQRYLSHIYRPTQDCIQ